METLTLRMLQYDCPYIDTSDDYDVTFHGMHWDFDPSTRLLETRMLATGADREALDQGLGALRDHDNMHQYELLSRRDDRAIIKNAAAETNAMGVLRDHGGYLTGPFEASQGREVWHVGFDDRVAADRALTDLHRHNEFTVESRTSLSFEEYLDIIQHVDAAKRLLDGCRSLTAVERKTIMHAVEAGYYRTPREATLDTLADEFGISKTAVSKNLRRAQRKLNEGTVEALSEL